MEEHSVKVSKQAFEDINSLKVHPKQPATEIIEKGLGLLKAFRDIKPMALESLRKEKLLTPEEKNMLRELFEKI